jgi:hypothetical protein
MVMVSTNGKMETDMRKNIIKRKNITMSGLGCSAIYFLDQKGKIIISRDYRGDVGQNITERF